MKKRIKLNNKIKIILSLAYGIFVYHFVSSWSFDYVAVVKTIKFFQQSELTYIEILAFNSFSTYFLTKVLNGFNAEFIASLFYGFCASLRFLVYSSLLPLIWFVPIFASMAVMLDFNTSRYSLATSIFILAFGVYRGQGLRNLGILKTSLLLIPFFHLHHFSVAFIALFSKTSYVFRTICISVIPILVWYSKDVFSRFLSDNGEPFPRITFVYFTLSMILIFSRRIHKSDFKVIYSVLLLLFAFHISGVGFNNAYYTRFSFLTFEVVLLMIALNNHAYRLDSKRLIFNSLYLKVFLVCSLSTVYQIVLIGGNIWRFF